MSANNLPYYFQEFTSSLRNGIIEYTTAGIIPTNSLNNRACPLTVSGSLFPSDSGVYEFTFNFQNVETERQLSLEGPIDGTFTLDSKIFVASQVLSYIFKDRVLTIVLKTPCAIKKEKQFYINVQINDTSSTTSNFYLLDFTKSSSISNQYTYTYNAAFSDLAVVGEENLFFAFSGVSGPSPLAISSSPSSTTFYTTPCAFYSLPSSNSVTSTFIYIDGSWAIYCDSLFSKTPFLVQGTVYTTSYYVNPISYTLNLVTSNGTEPGIIIDIGSISQTTSPSIYFTICLSSAALNDGFNNVIINGSSGANGNFYWNLADTSSPPNISSVVTTNVSSTRSDSYDITYNTSAQPVWTITLN